MTDVDGAPADPQEDFTVENGCVVFAAAFLRSRGECCGSGCRNCPFVPRHRKGSRAVAPTAPPSPPSPLSGPPLRRIQ